MCWYVVYGVFLALDMGMGKTACVGSSVFQRACDAATLTTGSDVDVSVCGESALDIQNGSEVQY